MQGIQQSNSYRRYLYQNQIDELLATILEEWEKEKIFLKLREKSKGREKFVICWFLSSHKRSTSRLEANNKNLYFSSIG